MAAFAASPRIGLGTSRLGADGTREDAMRSSTPSSISVVR